MKRTAPVVTVLVLLVCAAANAQKGPTLEQILSAPFPSELTAAAAKGRVAWVFNAQGARNVWVAEPSSDGSYKSRQLTSYKDDDGQDVGQLAWSADAETIVYTRGGDLEFLGASNPNPQHTAEGVDQNIWAIPFSGGTPAKLGDGHSPRVSKNGAVAFLVKGQIWSTKLDGSGKAEQLIHSNGDAGELRWSPDGSKLAFTSHRTDHAFIGVYDVSAKSLSYLDPSVDTDREPAWSPDSRRIAFIRVPVSKGHLPFNPRRESPDPWSIRIADVATGKSQEIWHADAGSGSVLHEAVAENQLIWAAGDRLVFPWERGGWLHLYSVAISGGSAKLLTPGNFEVEYVAASENGQQIVYSSNQDDIDRRHVWRVTPTSDRSEAVTTGTGIETAPVISSDNRTVIVLRSDPQTTMRPALVAAKGDLRDLAPQSLPVDFPASALVTPQQVVFSGSDGLPIHAQLFLPRNDAARNSNDSQSRNVNDPANDSNSKERRNAPERHPALVFFHGGSRRQMLLGWHYMLYYSNAYAQNQYLASRGYIVLAVNYRSGIGYGLNFREALNYGAAGASEFNDVLGAGLYLRSRPDVDPARIGLWGGSYGGYLTALGLARASDLYAAGVDMHGVHDWNLEIPNFAASYKPGEHTDVARLAWESSPLAAISTWHSPVLLVHGDDDRNVPFAQTVDLVQALRKQGVEFEELIFPDEIHDFLLHRSWLKAYHASSDFFDKHFLVPQK